MAVRPKQLRRILFTLMTESGQHLLPVFLVVGAQKAGTSTLDRWLRDYPEVALPRGKETHFFSDQEKFSRGMTWYLKQFPQCRKGQLRGEVAPQYMYSNAAAERIAHLLPDSKFIFLLRHPIDRAYSNYLMSVRQGAESLKFDDALRQEHQRLAQGDEYERNHFGYMARSGYAEQIKCYQQYFPTSPMYFALFEDLMDSSGTGDKVYAEVVSFIGLDYFLPPDRMIRENVASEQRFSGLRNFLYGSSRIKHWMGKLMPSRDTREQIAHFLDKLNQRPVVSLRPEVPQSILEACIAETDEIKRMTGLNIEKWEQITTKYKTINR